MSRDMNIGTPEKEPAELEYILQMEDNLLDSVNGLLANGSRIVSCPLIPKVLKSSDTATTIESGDTLGLVTEIEVPPSGEIRSATFMDFDDEGVQVDVFVFKLSIADVAIDAAYAPTDTEGLQFITKLSFVSFTDQGLFQTSELTNIGKAYSAPEGKFYVQGVVRGGYTVAANSPARIQIQIAADDPTWQER